MRDLEGQIALVTGGGKGVGKVVARSLVERGAHVLINCFHSYERAKQTQAELTALGGSVDILRASVARKDQVDRMFDEIEERFGRLDILVNNAASGSLGPVEQITAEHFGKALDANLLGSFWCATRAAPLMQGRNGRIVNVSSVGAGMVPDNYLVVGTSKAAVEALTRHLAAAFAPMGIRVNTASCSLIQGEVAELFPEASEMQRVTVESTPLRRLATAEDLAGVVTFLTCDLSRWVTGQVVLADGGLSLANAMLSPPKHATDAPVPERPSPPAPAAPADVATVADRERPDVHEADEDDRDDVGDEDDAIAVVGMGLAVPGANSPEEYWRQAIQGAERFVDVPADRWDQSAFHSSDPSAPDKTYQTRSGFITSFTPDPRLAEEISEGRANDEYTSLWLRHALHQALTGVHRHDDDKVLFAVGYTADGSQHLEESLVLDGTLQRLAELAEGERGDPRREELLGAARRVLEARLWRGRPGPAAFQPSGLVRDAMRGLLPDDTEQIVVDTACSSSLYAVDIGMKSLLLGTADVAVCGGSFALGPRGAVLFSKLHGLSTGGEVRSLDRGADGVLFSDGAGVVVLKRLSRALADGDRVLGLLAGLGASSDGKGKAIYAPSSSGQALAVHRAMEAPGVRPQNIDWVLAHATGTPAGDLAEVTTLRTALPAEHPVQVTSNKSLVGHTGWSAGVVSLIEVLLAMEHETIPGQYRFEEAPASFELDGSDLRISAEPVPWPRRPDRPRAASVSGFGFGGTNAHLVVEEYDGRGRPLPTVEPEEPVVLVGWSARLPELNDRAEVQRWLEGGATGPATSYGATYPRPPFDKVRIPPGTLRATDRCQLMLLESVFDLGDQLRDFWQEHADRTAVFAGHMGATRNSTLYGLRCYLDELRSVLSTQEPEAWSAGLGDLFERLTTEVRDLVPESTEDSFPGIMPNVIPARVANYLDFHGPNMTVDGGWASSLTALQVAMRYLRAGDIELALVAGINGNSTPEAQSVLTGSASGTGAPGATEVAEGVVTLAMVRESTARRHGLPVLARISEAPAASTGIPVGSSSRWAGYLGAAGAIEVLTAALSPSGKRRTVVSADSDVTVAIHVTPGDQQDADRAEETDEPRATVPAALLNAREYAPGHRTGVRRHVVTLEPEVRSPGGPGFEFVEQGTVVVTDDPRLVEHVRTPSDYVVITTPASRPSSSPAVRPSELSASAVTAALGSLGRPVRHVRLVTDLTAAVDPRLDTGADPADTTALHDLLFLTVQAAAPTLADGGSFVSVLLGGLPGGEVHPYAGMFTGFVKSTAIELPGCRTYAVVSSSRDPRDGIAQAVAESRAEHGLPLVVFDGDRRLTLTLTAEDAALKEGDPTRLGRNSTVLATGGSRGITGELLKALAAEYQPVIYVMGTSDLEGAEDLPDRAEFLRLRRQEDPRLTVAEVNADYERRRNVVTARETLDELRRHCGADRVHYLRADVRDPASVEDAVATALAQSGSIDLLLHTAGVNRSSNLHRKSLENFREVRDIKVVGYQNLMRALKGNEPAMWCNFSSFIGLTGQVGETDYAAANDFLGTASRYAHGVHGREQFAIGWNLWNSVGLGADPVKKAFLEKSGMYTRMATEEGVHHFLREVNLSDHPPFAVFMGDAEKAALLDYKPKMLPQERPTPTTGGFFLDRELTRTEDLVEYERTFDLVRDGYLAEHVVHGHPTLPGTFVTEVAAEAAARLEPSRHAVCFENASFSSFLRVYGADRPSRKRIRARVVSRDTHETVVRVQILTDVVAPNGATLATDREHFAVTVRMRADYPPAPVWTHWAAADDRGAVPDPYHLPNPAVLLTGNFVSTRSTRRSSSGRRAELDLHIAEDDERFRQFLVPAVMLDGLVRVSVLDPVDDGYVTLAAPRSMRRIDLYEPGNDLDLAARYAGISLYSSPGRIDLEDPESTNRCVAVRPDGRVVAQIHDTTTALLGYVHPETGDFRTPEQMTEVRRLRRSAPALTVVTAPAVPHRSTS